VVQRVPVQRVVAAGGGEADLLPADALSGEERPDVGLVLALRVLPRRTHDLSMPGLLAPSLRDRCGRIVLRERGRRSERGQRGGEQRGARGCGEGPETG